MQKHSPEPWTALNDRVWTHAKPIVECYSKENCNTLIPHAVAEANARRIVACVNACADIPTEALEAGSLAEMVERMEHYARLRLSATAYGSYEHGQLGALHAALCRLQGKS